MKVTTHETLGPAMLTGKTYFNMLSALMVLGMEPDRLFELSKIVLHGIAFKQSMRCDVILNQSLPQLLQFALHISTVASACATIPLAERCV